MERTNENQGNLKHANSSSAPAPNAEPASNNPNSGNPAAEEQPEQVVVVREQDHYMPIANVIRIMRKVLPRHAKISDEAKETVQECVSEYISFITGEANDRCQREQRKTVTAEDILYAMAKLGFDDYIDPLTLFLNRLRGGADVGGSSGAGGSGGSERQRGGSAAAYGSGFNLAQYQGVLDAMGGVGGGSGGGAGGGYFRGAAGGGGSSGGGSGGGGASGSSSGENGGIASYDPFTQFK